MRAALMRAFIPPTWPGRLYYLVFCSLLLALIWQSFDRTAPAEVLGREVVNEDVHPGGILKIRNRIVRYRTDTEVRIYRQLYDGCTLRFDYEVNVLPAGSLPLGEETYTTQVPVSGAACPGPARLDSIACWSRMFNVVHIFWPVCVPLKSIRFTIAQS